MKTSIHNKGRSLFVSFIIASAFVICSAKNGYCSENEVKEENEENIVVRKFRSAKEFVSSNKEEILKYYGYVREALPYATLILTLINTFRLGGLRNIVNGVNKGVNEGFANVNKRFETIESSIETINQPQKPTTTQIQSGN